MLRTLLLLAVTPLSAQTAEDLLSRLNDVRWEAPPPAACATHLPVQMDVYATTQYTHHCSGTASGIVLESFFYVFGEPARIARLRVDLRPADEAPATTARLLPELQRALTARFGIPTHDPELMEIGFRRLRYGQPVAGDHWHGAGLHYFLHANQSNPSPLGMRRGVQLIVINDRLFAERLHDATILRVEGFSGEAREEDDPIRARLSVRIGAPYVRAISANFTNAANRARLVQQTTQDLAAILRESETAGRPRRALALLAADQMLHQLSLWLIEPSPSGEHESGEAANVRRLASRYGVKLGAMTHYGGLAYRHELLWRVWRELPETEGGELAFLDLQRRGWNTEPGEGCPGNPDLFRDVITRAESFLAAKPNTEFRQYVLYALAQANESWWSIARSPADDPIVSAPPYPRRELNARQAGRALAEAIRYYREVAALAPGTPEAESALRRLPRLELQLDTGQRRFFCSYC